MRVASGSIFVAVLLAFGCAAGEAVCETGDCFVEHVDSCTPATYVTDTALDAEGRYEVVGPATRGCRISFRYTRNPDPELVGASMTLVVESGDRVREAVAECLAGRGEGLECEGELTRIAAAFPIADSPDPFPCGAPITGDDPALFAMPDDGLWGFVGTDGEWLIEPQWDRVEPFSEGRAAVAVDGSWGVIDTRGEYVLLPSLESQSFITVDDRRVGLSPVAPYSEGCAAAVADTAEGQPFFIDREGGIHWRSAPPAALADLDVREFGPFSEGKAWFRTFDVALAQPHGWIDRSGEIVIEPEFAGAGSFVDGLAPAATEPERWGFIDTDGELVLPGKWTLAAASAFSGQRALVDLGTYDWGYLRPDGEAVRSVRFDDGRGEVPIARGGDFHDGLAPVLADLPDGNRLAYVDPEGEVRFVPGELHGFAVCNAEALPEFRDGAVRLVVADDGSCGDAAYASGLPSYPDAHYLYLDTEGAVLVDQSSLAS